MKEMKRYKIRNYTPNGEMKTFKNGGKKVKMIMKIKFVNRILLKKGMELLEDKSKEIFQKVKDNRKL